MESFNLLKFWRNAISDVTPGVDHVSKVNCIPYQAPDQTDEETDDDDSFFELEITAPPLDSNASKPQSPITVLRSAPKIRGFSLGFRKSKPEKRESNGALTASPKIGQSKRFSVKEVPAVPFLSRDNSLRSKLQRESLDESSSKRFEKDLPKYLKLIKPLYTRASRMTSPLSSPAPERLSLPSKISDEKQGNRVAILKNVYKQLGRSRSELSSVGTMPSPVNRRDDLLLQHHDIQSAILHCKQSYNSSANSSTVLLARRSI